MSQLFTYESHQVRTVTEMGETWFAAADVCKALGISWRGNTLTCISEKWKRTMRNFRMEGFVARNLVFISEPAVYKLAFRSNKPEADAFTNWVASEVLPAIRKTGKFEANNNSRARPAQAELPPAPETPRKDKYEAYIEEVEAFRAKTAAEIDQLLDKGLDLVDFRKFGTNGIAGFTPILIAWLQGVAGQHVPLVSDWHSMKRAIEYSPLCLMKRMEAFLPDRFAR